MKALLPILALVLLASVVTGGEKQIAGPEVVYPVDKRIAEPVAPVEELDLRKLQRQRREGRIQDLFANPVPVAVPRTAPVSPPLPAAVVAVAPEPPPAPVAPALPFKYLGRMDTRERSLVYLLKNQDMVTAVVGETLDKDYRVERITTSAVHLVYLPLGTAQVLAIPAAP